MIGHGGAVTTDITQVTCYIDYGSTNKQTNEQKKIHKRKDCAYTAHTEIRTKKK